VDVKSNYFIVLSVKRDLRLVGKGGQWIYGGRPDFVNSLEVIPKIRTELAQDSHAKIGRFSNAGFTLSQEGLKVG
jgi:hypothetical protein